MDQIKPKRHKWIRRLLWVIGAMVILVAALPLWFPWVLKPALAHLGFNFIAYQRIGYTRFAVTDLNGSMNGAKFQAQRLECALPTAWLWESFVSGTNQPPVLVLAGGKFQISRSVTNTLPTAKESKSAVKTFDQIQKDVLRLRRFLPAAELTNCAIRLISQQVSLPFAVWRDGRLQAAIQSSNLPGEIHVDGELEGKSALRLAASWPAYDFTLHSKFFQSTNRWRLTGLAQWRTNQATLSAWFSTNSWWPAHARVSSRNLQVPANLVDLYGYEDLHGDLAIDLVSNEFSLQITGFAQPSSNFLAKGFSTANFAFALNGNPQLVTLDKLNVQSSWLSVALTNSMTLTWNGRLMARPAQLSVSMDLGKFPGSTMTGRVEGSVRVRPRGSGTPTAQFDFAARQIHAWHENAEHIVVRGDFASPRVKFDRISARLADGSEFSASGSLNYTSRQITDAEWKFSGPFLKWFIPGLTYSNLTASGQMQGSLTNLTQSGQATIKDLRSKFLKPLDADMRWNGQKFQFDSLDLKLTAGQSALVVSGAADLNAFKQHKFSVTLTNVSLSRGSETLYALQQPCAISFSESGTIAASREWAFSMSHFDWQGTNREASLNADVAWPSYGKVESAFTNVVLRDFADFADSSVTNFQLAACHTAAHWSNSPVRASIYLDGSMTNPAGKRMTLSAAMDAGKNFSVKRLSLETGCTPALSVTGSVPVEIVPARKEGWLLWHKSETLALTGNWQNQETKRMALPLGTRGKLEVSRPQMHFEVSGTPEKPLASLDASAADIVWQSGTNLAHPMKLTDLKLQAKIQRSGIKLDTLTARVAGQPISASGEWNLSTKDWETLVTQRELPGLTNAQGQLEVPGTRLSALADWLPQQVAPQGQLSAKVDLKTGEHVEGFLVLTNAATRQLGPLAPLRNIHVRLELNDRRAVLKTFYAQIEDQPIRGSGFVNLSKQKQLDYQLEMRGTNVPLVQSLQLLMRGNFALELRGSNNVPPELSGRLDLHDGLFLMHTSSLFFTGGRKRPHIQPPYFSITNEPLADWKLSFTVAGDRFLRVQTPVFNGRISANMKLAGTMRAPVLTGDARVTSGTITFPFGNLSVKQAYASFTGNNPQGPDLYVSASGQNYGYGIQLDVKGPANNPQVMFSSTPPLTSEQVLLMLRPATFRRTRISTPARPRRAGWRPSSARVF